MDFDWHWPNGQPVTNPHGPRLAYDIETNGLLPDVSTIHSLVIEDLDNGKVYSCAGDQGRDVEGYLSIDYGLELLASASVAFGHNVLGYDSPVLKHLKPDWVPPFQRDTLVLSKMIWPTDKLKDLDFPRWNAAKARGRPEDFPGQLIGAHKLEAWGYRLGKMKGEYSATVKKLSKEYTEHGDLTKVPEEYRVLATYDKSGRPILDPWLRWNKPMQDYCEQDVRVTVEFLRLCIKHLSGVASAAKGVSWSPMSVFTEHLMWVHCLEQEERGFGYDLKSGVKLASDLKNRQARLEKELKSVFGSWFQPTTKDVERGEKPAKSYSAALTQYEHKVTRRRFSEKTGKELKPYVGPPLNHFDKDAPFVKGTIIDFNPKSRRHLGDRLQAVFGWQPTEWVGKEEDQAKVDETTIKEMEESVLPQSVKEMILEYLVVSKTLGQLADGRKSWNDLCGPDGRIHGRVDPLGTVSHRGAHKDPNLGQVPSVTVKETKDATGSVIAKEVVLGWKGGFGAECRSLFRPGSARMPCQTGTDASGLELRLLGHYLHPYDDGAFATRVSTPGLDIHAENAKITGLSRAETKTTTYAFLYGAGNLKIGIGVGVPEEQIAQLSTASSAQSYVRFMKKVLKDKFVMPDKKTLALIARGSEVSKAFLNGITGLKDLKDAVTAEGQQFGFIIALDGRKLYIRKPHASLNQLLQGGGAIVCKMWALEVDAILQQDHHLKPDWDYGQMGWIHDELQFEHQDGLQEVIAAASSEGMRRVAEKLNFRGELATESKHGSNWMECH